MPDKSKTTLSKAEINRRHYQKRVAKARKAAEGASKKTGLKPIVKFPLMGTPDFQRIDRFTGKPIAVFIP